MSEKSNNCHFFFFRMIYRLKISNRKINRLKNVSINDLFLSNFDFSGIFILNVSYILKYRQWYINLE